MEIEIKWPGTHGKNFQNSLWECQYFRNVWLINLHGRKGLFMPVETKWQIKEIKMGNKDGEFQLQRQNTKTKPRKSRHRDLKTIYQKRMNPWLGRQGSCLDIGNLTFFSSHKKEKRIQNTFQMMIQCEEEIKKNLKTSLTLLFGSTWLHFL